MLLYFILDLIYMELIFGYLCLDWQIKDFFVMLTFFKLFASILVLFKGRDLDFGHISSTVTIN